jgi:transcriptional regulator with XRE-family HTH domain
LEDPRLDAALAAMRGLQAEIVAALAPPVCDSEVETVGERIRRRREELGLAHRDLGCPGITYSYLSRLETNDRAPSMKALRLLAPKLRVSVHWLETGQSDPAIELAQLVLEHRGNLVPERAVMLAWAVLRSGLDPCVQS